MTEPKVIYKDENFLAINKPAGLLVHGVRGKKRGASGRERAVGASEKTLVDWLAKRYPEIKTVGDDPEMRPGIVHRLDRDASGVMVVAKNQKYFEYLKSLFQKRLIKKTYLALVSGRLTQKSGRIEKSIGVKSGTVKRSVSSSKMSKDAVTDYRLKRVFETAAGGPISFPVSLAGGRPMRSGGEQPHYFSLVEVEPKTGRTHQIRVHLASIGHPIVGDRLYGRRSQPEWAKRLMLHATSLEFPLLEDLPRHTRVKAGRRFKVEAEPPGDYLGVIDFLSF